MRDAPSVEIARAVQAEGAVVKAYAPVAMHAAERMMSGVQMRANAYEVAEGADLLILCTEWNEFKQLDLGRLKQLMKRPVLVDGRNLYDPRRMKEVGFQYRGIGRQ